VASIDSSGLATSLTLGQTSITAQAFNMTSNAALLTITLPLTRVSGLSPFSPNCTPLSGVAYINAEVEPWLAIDPLDPNHLIGIYQQDRRANGGARGLVTAVSRDGGVNWTPSMAPFSLCTGGTSPGASDPWVTIAPDGTIYESAGIYAGGSIAVSRSTDGGATWSSATLLDSDPEFADDKDSITADPGDSHFVYAVWDREPSATGATWFARTTDSGQTWEPARSIYAPGTGFATLNNEVTVLPDGTLLDFFYLFSNTSNFLAVIRSADQGVTWSEATVIDFDEDIGTVDVKTGDIVREGVAQYAVDRQSGVVYVVSLDARFSGGKRNGILLYKSTDGGQTWSAPRQINQAPNVQAFCPTIAVAQDGSIAVNYYDFRQDGADSAVLLTNYWQLTSRDGGQTWQEVPLAGPFDLLTAPNSGGLMITDYEGLAASGSSFVSFFIQTNSGDTSNRTDVFALSDPLPGDTSTNGHIEINSHPLGPAELHREEAEQEALPHVFLF
jgi:hypothetical protein